MTRKTTEAPANEAPDTEVESPDTEAEWSGIVVGTCMSAREGETICASVGSYGKAPKKLYLTRLRKVKGAEKGKRLSGLTRAEAEAVASLLSAASKHEGLV